MPELLDGGDPPEAQGPGYVVHRSLANDQDMLVVVVTEHFQRGVRHHHLVLVNIDPKPTAQFVGLKEKQVGKMVYSKTVNGKSLNCIKQLRLKDNLRLKRGFSMQALCPHEYDIPSVRGGHLEGPHVFGFLIHAFPSEIWSQT